MTFAIEELNITTLEWFVGVAATRMLVEEYKRPELLHYPSLYGMATKAMTDGTGLVVTKDGEPVGAIGSLLIPNVFNPKYKTLTEVFWYVLPDYRNSRAGSMLLNAFDAKGKELADEATLSLLSSSQVNIQGLAKRGYNLKELGFVKHFKET